MNDLKQRKNAKKGQFADKATRNNCNKKLSKKRNHDGEDKNANYGMHEDDFMIPVVFHNLRGYDGRIIIKDITKDFATEDTVVIPTTSEKFITLKIGNLRFLDSLQFLSASLDTLVQTLIKDGTQKFPNTKGHYPNSDLAFQKETYPYEFLDGPEKFKLRERPAREKFYSSLSEETLSEEDYARAQQMWTEFHISNMKEYHWMCIYSPTSLKTLER